MKLSLSLLNEKEVTNNKKSKLNLFTNNNDQNRLKYIVNHLKKCEGILQKQKDLYLKLKITLNQD